MSADEDPVVRVAIAADRDLLFEHLGLPRPRRLPELERDAPRDDGGEEPQP